MFGGCAEFWRVSHLITAKITRDQGSAYLLGYNIFLVGVCLTSSRFSCFPTPIHYNKSKKSVQQFAETINTNSQSLSQHRVTLDSSCSAASNPHLKAHKSNNSETSAEQNLSSSSFESSWKLGEMNNKFSPDDSGEALRKGLLRKSQSLGSGLDRERSTSIMDLEDDAETVADKYVHNVNVDLVNPEAHFFIGDSSQFEEVLEVTGARISGGSTGDYAHLTTSVVPFMVVNSISQPNLRDIQGDGSPAYGKTRSKSFDNIIARDERNSVYETDGDTFPSRVISYRSRSASSCHNMLQTSVSLEKKEECVLSNQGGASFEIADYEQDDKCQNQFIDGNDSCNCSDLLHGWAHLEQEEVDDGHDHRAEMQDSLSCRDYNMKRIEEWVNRIDLQNNLPLQEIGESSNSASKRDSSEVDGEGSVKLDSRFSPGMEVANNYISSLTPTSSSAQMANLGLAVIPFFSAFVSLRVLNLSGNTIVRITAGTLPRGLHVLNLSKNYICAIEGLRELSRLRILDLSNNRICRIGHGLASCTALKELYLAGNKISEVEGLHRLLKLAIVDLRFNKISTTKCLGQLAANYNSMQAINLEGNPAQRNVGDEQLRKYLLGLLPNLMYFNKQTIRNGSSKEASDRHARSMTVSPFDRGARAEHKPSRRISHGGSTHKAVLFSSGHGRAVGSPKRSKGRHVRNPLGGLRGANHQLDIGSKVLSLQSLQSIRRSRSEGTFTLLGA